MRMLWTLVKLVVALALGIPVALIVLVVALGLFGAAVGLALLTLKLAIVGLIAWGLFRVVAGALRGHSPRSRPKEIAELPPADPHYDAAMRELDQELGEAAR